MWFPTWSAARHGTVDIGQNAGSSTVKSWTSRTTIPRYCLQMGSTASDTESVVLQPSWHSTAAVGPLVAVILVPLALVFDDSVAQAVVYAVVFGIVFAFLDQRRKVELTRAEATVHDVWRRRSIERTEVRGVARGQWWNGGVRLSTGGKDFWLRVGDQPFGRVSDQRLAVVADWAGPPARICT